MVSWLVHVTFANVGTGDGADVGAYDGTAEGVAVGNGVGISSQNLTPSNNDKFAHILS